MKRTPVLIAATLLLMFLIITYMRYDWHFVGRCGEKFCMYGIAFYIGD